MGLLELKHLTKSFGRFKALDDLSMYVPKGAIYGLVGPNGAGKSTAIRHMVGVYRPDSGTVTVEGLPVFENPAVKTRIGYIPDDFFYFPAATVEEMRKFYRGIYPYFDDALFQRIQEIFRLPRRPIRQFSKGMQKQAAFQLVLSTHPELLILDEPVDGLDPVMRRQVWNLILADQQQYGTTVVISSHNLRELEDVCNHVGIMNKGKMLLEKSLADMQGNVVKLQMVGSVPETLKILQETATGQLRTLVVQGTAQEITEKMQAAKPVFFDILPLSLEEVFIYELGGADYEVKDIIL